MIFVCSMVSQPLIKCRRVFQALINIAVEELCEICDSLIAPVRMGVARPTAPFSLVSSHMDAVQGSEELFILDPLPTRSTADTTNDTAFLSRPENPTPTIAISHVERNAERDQDHDDDSRLSAAGEEVIVDAYF